MRYIITIEIDENNAYSIIEKLLTEAIDNSGLDAVFYLEEVEE